MHQLVLKSVTPNSRYGQTKELPIQYTIFTALHCWDSTHTSSSSIYGENQSQKLAGG